MKYVVRYDRLVEGHEEQHLYRQMVDDPTTTSDELRALFNKYSEIDVSIAEHGNCPEDVLAAIYEKHKHRGMQRIRIFSTILSHPNLTSELATKMLNDHSEKEIDLGSAIHELGACTKLTKDQLFEVLVLNVDTTRAVFRNPSLGDDGIREILASGHVSVYQLLLNPAMSTKTILDALSDNIEGYEKDEDDTKLLKEELAKRGDVLDELLEAKGWDDETSAAEFAFKNRLTSAAELTIFIDLMLARGERSLLIDAAMHSNTSLEDLRKLAKYSDDTMFYVAGNKNIDDDLAKEIWDANDENAQENLMVNSSCPTDVLIKAMSSPFDFVAKAAKEAIKRRDVLGDLLGEAKGYHPLDQNIQKELRGLHFELKHAKDPNEIWKIYSELVKLQVPHSDMKEWVKDFIRKEECSPEFLDELFDEFNDTIYTSRIILGHKNISTSTLEKAVDWTIHSTDVAYMDFLGMVVTSCSAQLKLLKKDRSVSWVLVKNPKLCSEVAMKIWKEYKATLYDDEVHDFLLRPTCPTELLIEVSSDPKFGAMAKRALQDRNVLGDLLGENTNYKMKNKHIASYLDHQINEMAIIDRSKMPRQDKIEIDLSGPEGNAFNLLALAKRLYSQLHKEEIDVWKRTNELMKAQGKPALPSPMDILLQEMMESNYDNLINIFDREFGDFVTLYR